MSSLISGKPELYLGWAYDRVEEQDKNNAYIDKIGGKPVWFNPNCPPPTSYAICDNCGERLFLLMQLQGHITKRKYDRIFYVWGCNNSQCMGKKGSFKVLRAHKGTHYKKHTKINKTLNKINENPVKNDSKSELEQDVSVTNSQSSLNSNNNTPIKPAIDMKPVVIDPKEYENEINEIKEINDNSNNNGLEFGFGNVTDFSWDTPTFGGDANNDDWGTLGDNNGFGDSNGFGFGDSSNGFGSNSKNNDDDMDDLNKLLELRNKKYEESDDEDDENVNDNSDKNNKEEEKEPQDNKKVEPEVPKKVEKETVEESKDEKEEITPEEKEELEKIKQYWEKGRFFPDYYLDMDLDQPNTEKDDYSHEKKLIEEYEKQNKIKGNDNSEMNWGEEKYEKTDNKYYNKVFRKFNEVVQEEPEQCLRYFIKGEPLFYDNDDVSKKFSNPKNIPRCEKCGAMRTFEFQLMPNILSVLPTEKFLNKRKPRKNIHNLKDANSISRSDLIKQFDTGMEWGTILVFTCSKDCDMDEIHSTSKDTEDDGMWREDISYYEELPVIEMESLF